MDKGNYFALNINKYVQKTFVLLFIEIVLKIIASMLLFITRQE